MVFSYGDESQVPLHRYRERARNEDVADLNLADLAFLEQALELALRERLHLPGLHPQLAQPQHREPRGEEIPDGDLRLPAYRDYFFFSRSRKCLRNFDTLGSTTAMQ